LLSIPHQTISSASDAIEERVIEELAPLLQTPKQLAHLPQYISQFKEKLTRVRSNMLGMYERVLSDQITAYSLLNKILQMKSEHDITIKEITKTALESKTLISSKEELDMIKEILIVRKNIRRIQHLVSQTSAVPTKLTKVKEIVEFFKGERDPPKDQQIKKAYLTLRELVLLRNKVYKEGSSQSHAQSEEFLQDIKREFGGISEVAKELKNAVMENVEDTLELCESDPTTLIYTLMIIEIEDRSKKAKVFSQDPILEEFGIGNPSGTTLKAEAIDKVNVSIWDTFARVFGSAQKEETLGADGDEGTMASNAGLPMDKNASELAFKRLDTLVKDLFLVQRLVVQLYPPSYNILKIYVEGYLKGFTAEIERFLVNAEKMTQPVLSSWRRWIDGLGDTLKYFNMRLPDMLRDQTDRLVKILKLKQYEHLRDPVEKVIHQEKLESFQETDDVLRIEGCPVTKGTRDLFSVLYMHWSATYTKNAKNFNVKALVEVVRTYAGILIYQQRQHLRYLSSLECNDCKIFVDGKEWDELRLVAWINSSIRYRQLVEELKMRVKKDFQRKVADDQDLKRPESKLQSHISIGDDDEEYRDSLNSIYSDLNEADQTLESCMVVASNGYQRVTKILMDGFATYMMEISKDDFSSLSFKTPAMMKNTKIEDLADFDGKLDSNIPESKGEERQKKIESDSSTPVEKIAEELQGLLQDHRSRILGEDTLLKLAKKLLKKMLSTYCSQFLGKNRKLSEDARIQAAKAFINDKFLMKRRLQSSNVPGGGTLYTYDAGVIDECFALFDFLLGFLKYPTKDAAQQLKKNYKLIIAEYGKQSPAIILNLMKLRSDLRLPVKEFAEDFEEELSNWEVTVKNTCVDQIAQNLEVPWSSMPEEPEEVKSPHMAKSILWRLLSRNLDEGQTTSSSPAKSPLKKQQNDRALHQKDLDGKEVEASDNISKEEDDDEDEVINLEDFLD